MKRFLSIAAMAIFFAVIGTDPTFAAEGSIIIRVDDGVKSKCIVSTDRLTAILRRAVIEKNSKWLGLIADNEIGLTFTTRLSGVSGSENQTASFVTVAKQDLKNFSNGQVSLANELPLLRQFPLKTSVNSYTTVAIEIGLLKTKGKSASANIILGAIGATQGLSIPSDPFSAGFKVASAYVDSFVKPLIDSAAKEKEAITNNIVMSINSGNCSEDDEKTGTKVILDASDHLGSGYIDISMADQYCYRATLTPAFALKYASKAADATCTGVSYVDVKNNYLAIVVNALPAVTPNPVAGNPLTTIPGGTEKSAKLGELLAGKGLSATSAAKFANAVSSSASPPDAIAQAFRISEESVEAYREALARCEAHGFSMESCVS